MAIQCIVGAVSRPRSGRKGVPRHAAAVQAGSRGRVIFDFEKITPPFILGTAAVVFALGITYWLISKKT
ncbi:phosphate-starvation-inducible PsiE family protein [Thiohalobacter sp. IOR34]|uniref:phosphate-starvation-inducible PsiE family protein n=1 Tax=Thiohalobacter sp. IOR34 TaxID=3057176 RepID=UPI00339D9BBF